MKDVSLERMIRGIVGGIVILAIMLTGCSARGGGASNHSVITQVITMPQKTPQSRETETPPKCTAMPKGMELRVAEKHEQWVLEGQGFRPGERVSIADWCEGHHVEAIFGLPSPHSVPAVDVDGNGQFVYEDWAKVFPLGIVPPDRGIICQVYVTHTGGTACIKVKLTRHIEELP